LYVVNRDDNTIVQFTIGKDGKLYPENTVNTPGIFPVSVATSKGFLFVVDSYMPLPNCSPASPCSGSVAVFPILAASAAGSKVANTLGTPVVNSAISTSYWPLTLPGAAATDIFVPSAINVAGAGAYVYVAGYDANTNAGYIFGFAPGSDGALAALPGFPVQVGTHPSSITSDPSGSYLYVTDAAQNAAYGFQISGGALTPLNGSPFATGSQPSAIVLDGTAKYAIVANTQDSNVTVYSVNSGSLSKLGTYTTGTQPVAIGIDPSLNQYIYTANFLGNTVSGFQLNPGDGTLLNSQFSPSASNPNPTAVAAVTHNGNKK
jgi:6-phosphogluconolactonase